MNVEIEFKDIDSRRDWSNVFQRIRNETNYDLPCSEARKAANKHLNRYRDVSPYDHSRVVLKAGPTNYINANLLQIKKAQRSYILAQGPLPNTAGHFWLMVWEQNSMAIVMLNKVIEKNQVKCHHYWPKGLAYGGTDDLVMEDVKIKVTFVSQTDVSYYIVREFLLTNLSSDEQRTVYQFHYHTWPDFGVPQSPSAFLRFLKAVRVSGVLSDYDKPPVVHCSAGIGRSGTFSLVDTALVLMEKEGVNSVDVIDLLKEMRKSRIGLIQTADQLRFSYLAIIEGAKMWNMINENHISTSNEVENSKTNDISDSDSSVEELEDFYNDSSDSDVPPPLPPRGESLNITNHLDNGVMEINGTDESPLSKPLPLEPSEEQYSAKMSPKHEEVRKRKLADSSDSIQKQKIQISEMHNNDRSPLDGFESPPLVPPRTSSDNDKTVVPPNPSVEDESVVLSPSSSNELRKRQRKEENDKLAAKVEAMKDKMKSEEVWQERKRWLFHVGVRAALVTTVATSIVLLYRYISLG